MYVDYCFECYLPAEGNSLHSGPSEEPTRAFDSDWELVDIEEWSTTFPGAGPSNVDIHADFFIPDEWVTSPINSDFIFAGDYREFGFERAARITLKATAANTAITSTNWVSSPNAFAGLSKEYSASDLVGGHIRNDATPVATDYASVSSSVCDSYERLGSQFGVNTSSVRIHCTVTGSDPLIPFSPPATMTFTWTMTFGNNSVAMDVQGCHKVYPAYEIYLNTGNDTALNAPKESEDPTSLFGSCSSSFHWTGSR